MKKLIGYLVVYFLGIFSVLLFQRYNPATGESRTFGESIQNVSDGIAKDFSKTKEGLSEDIEEGKETARGWLDSE